MMKLAIFASLVAGAAAFAPTKNSARKSTAVNAKAKRAPKVPSQFAEELGVQVPLGYWDPFHVMLEGNTDKFDYFREVEITHGRVAMLAVVGQLTTRAGIHFPGDFYGTAYADIPSGVKAFDVVPQELGLQILFTMGFLQCFMRDIPGTGNEFPGDYRNGWIDFGWDQFDEKTKLSKRSIELNNGRAAQMGILGMIVHEQLGTNMPFIGQM
jgi:hypothetical protein